MLTKEITVEEFVEIRVEEAREEARMEKLQNAKNLKLNGVDLKTIAISLGLTQQEVMAI